MEEFIAILREYKDVIACAVCIILTIVGICVKKKPKTIDEFLLLTKEVCLALPDFINGVEVKGHGALKKNKVEDSAYKLMKKSLGRSLSDYERDFFIKEVDSSIEAILSTPQKKGD